MLALMMLLSLLIIIALVVVAYVGMWKCFVKAGEKGWYALIPFYNYVVLYRITGMNTGWVAVNIVTSVFSVILDLVKPLMEISYEYLPIYLLISLISLAMSIFELVITIILMIRFCKSFNKGGGYIAGMILVAPIFYMIIGCGDAKYVGPNGVPKEEKVAS